MSDMHDPGPAEIARAIGRRVRGARIDRGWTLDQLAEQSGVSRRLLVNVEHGTANPSIATLLRLSHALGLGLPDLVDVADDPAGPVSVRRAGQAAPVWRSSAGGAAAMVCGTSGPDVAELWDWRLGPGDVYRSEPHRAGTRELLLVVSGRLVLTVGDVDHPLRPGDSAMFDGAVEHAYRNGSTTRPARFVLAVHEPDLS